MEEIDQRVLECFRAVFPTLTDEELTGLEQAQQPAWDSLASLSLITVIEEEFDLMLDDSDIPEMNTFQKVCAAMAERGQSR